MRQRLTDLSSQTNIYLPDAMGDEGRELGVEVEEVKVEEPKEEVKAEEPKKDDADDSSHSEGKEN